MSTKSKSKGHASDANVDADYPSDFGIFYPTGSLMAGFPTEKQAIDIQKELIAGGKSVADCTLLSSEAILTAADHNLKMHDGFLARLGWSAKAVQIHLDLARR